MKERPFQTFFNLGSPHSSTPGEKCRLGGIDRLFHLEYYFGTHYNLSSFWIYSETPSSSEYPQPRSANGWRKALSFMRNRIKSLTVRNVLSFGENVPEIILGDLNWDFGPSSGVRNLYGAGQKNDYLVSCL